MATVKKGDTIKIHYVGTFEDGTVFDSAESGPPVEIKLGEGAFLKELEDGFLGMSPGDKKTITMEQPYGPKDEEKIFGFDRKKLPPHLDLHIGKQIQMHRADGKPVVATVNSISESTITLDRNDPLAGKNLIYNITLEEIL